MRTWIILAASALFVSGAATAWAHHSFGAEYDADKPITLKGVVTKIEWTNPHTHMYLDVKGTDGKAVNWKLEGFPPVVLYRTGWKRGETLNVGDEITVTGWQARDGGNWGHSRQVTFANGKQLYFGPPAGTGDGGGRPAADLPTEQ